MMYNEFRGSYLDGHSAARQSAVVFPLQDGLEITTDSGMILWWPYDEIQQTKDFDSNNQVRLERGKDIQEILLVPEDSFFTALREIHPKMAKRFRRPASRRRTFIFALLAAVAVIGLTKMLYFWGIPSMASVVASCVPVFWEEQLGQGVVESLAPHEKQCLDTNRLKKIEELIPLLTANLPEKQYNFRIYVLNDPMVNAFAAPGGSIVVCRGLLEKTQNAEELAGVLAHELQHILHRHATRRILQEASLGLLFTALTGGMGGAIMVGLEGARNLGTLHYSRQNEEEADAEAIPMLLAAGIDPRGMVTFFERLKKEEGKYPEVPVYLSTHPDLEDRIARLQALANQGRQNPIKLLPGENWNDIRNACPEKVKKTP
jgi:beta-barrel assembly-enhancing protease